MDKVTLKEMGDIRAGLGVTQYTVCKVLDTSINNIAAIDAGRILSGEIHDKYLNLLREFCKSRGYSEIVEELNEIEVKHTELYNKKISKRRRTTAKKDNSTQEVFKKELSKIAEGL